MQSHFRHRAPQGEQEMSVSLVPRACWGVMPTQHLYPHPQLRSHRACRDLSTAPLREPRGIPSGAEGSAPRGREVSCCWHGVRVSVLCPCPPMAGISKAEDSCGELLLLALWALVSLAPCLLLLQTDGREHPPCYHTRQDQRSRRNSAAADSLSLLKPNS